ncbi:MAG: glycosyltransferase [Proteobacteria bacterium]|nr:glycosyltransferase [Pseudomonadota bacterium]
MSPSDLIKPAKIVFTVALKSELPVSWISKHTVDIFSIGRLKAEGPQIIKHPLVTILTGIGPSASSEAALWVRDHLDAFAVVNIGTAGSVTSQSKIGDWVLLSRASSEQGDSLALDTRIPFPWPRSLPLRQGGTLLSVSEPRYGQPAGDYDYVDMEAYYQAKVFSDTPVSFHVLKVVSDHCLEDTKKQYFDNLEMVRESVRGVFHFLSEPGEPDISVIVPVHNREKSIAPCVESILGQTLPPKELIVVDDGSTDKTLNALRPYQNQIQIISMLENKGVSRARNKGVEQASCRWISFLDSDDLWNANKLHNQWRFLEKNPFFQIIQSEEIWIRNNVRVNPHKHHKKLEGWIWSQSLALCLITPSGVMIERDLLEDYGGFDESLLVCEDYDLWIRITRDHPVGLDPIASVIKYGGHDDQLSKRYPAMDRFRVQSLVAALQREVDDNYRQQLRNVLEKKIKILADGCKKRKKFKEAKYYESLLIPYRTKA